MFTVPVIAAVFVFRWALCCALFSCVIQLVWCTRELVPVPALLESHALSACVAPDREALHRGAVIMQGFLLRIFPMATKTILAKNGDRFPCRSFC